MAARFFLSEEKAANESRMGGSFLAYILLLVIEESVEAMQSALLTSS